MRTARGRRRIWRAARRAAEQARDNDGVGETQIFAEEAEGETGGRKKWERTGSEGVQDAPWSGSGVPSLRLAVAGAYVRGARGSAARTHTSMC